MEGELKQREDSVKQRQRIVDCLERHIHHETVRTLQSVADGINGWLALCKKNGIDVVLNDGDERINLLFFNCDYELNDDNTGLRIILR